MKQQPGYSILCPQPAHRGLHTLMHSFGLLLAGIFILLVSACDSSSSDGIDPNVFEIPIAYINRPIPVDNMGLPVQADLRDPLLFSEGGDVFLRTSSSANATVTNITFPVTQGMGDVKGLNASFDGKKLVFSLREFDPDPNNDPTPAWNIYEYDLETSLLRPVINNATAEEGDDLFPAYLPDGRIVFTSTRQKQAGAVLADEGKSGFSAMDEDENTIALVLHVMNPTGSNLHQISFNQSHDLYPLVLENNNGGQVVFSRWDNTGGNDSVHLYKSNPDGSDLEMIYGRHSHNTGTNPAVPIQFSSPREMTNGDIMVIAKPYTGTFDGGDIYIVDAGRFSDIDKPIWSLSGLPGPGQRVATVNNIPTDGTISVNGRYSSAFPLQDGSGRILVSKSICQVSILGQLHPCVDPFISNPAAVEESPAYSIWLYDMNVNTEKVVVLAVQGRVITEAIALLPRTQPPVVFDKGPGQLDPNWDQESVGVINISSVYDMGDSTFNRCFLNVCTLPASINSVEDLAEPLNLVDAANPATPFQPPARFVRFVKAVGIPDPDDRFGQLGRQIDLIGAAFGPQRRLGMRASVGYAPIEPDGSVKVKVPANVALAIEVLDSEGRRIGPRHENWFQVQPGDTLNCTGCHTHPAIGPTPEVHSRTDGTAPTINSGLDSSLQFSSTVIPGTNTVYWGASGQTMAEVRFDRYADAGLGVVVEPRLHPDLVFEDYWTDPLVTPPSIAVPFRYEYAQLDASIRNPVSGSSLLNPFCVPWRFNCRVTVNYPQHIHSIWQLDRGVDAFTPTDPPNPPDPTPNGIGDDTCTECHTSAGGTRVADGDLDLTTDPNQVLNNFYRSYVELLFDDQGEMLDANGNLVPIQVLVPDPNVVGAFILVDDPNAAITRRMTEAGARRSYFIEKMTETEIDATRTLAPVDPDPKLYFDHSGLLSVHELKLISEWLDMGAQNFNDPFDLAAPQN